MTFILQTQLGTHHYQECIVKRGLNLQWILANCRSYSANEASQYLGYTAQSDGIWLEGCNNQSQFKPDKPWLSETDKAEGKKKAPKYRSQTGEYDAMLPTHPDDPHYWDNLEGLKKVCYQVDGHPCLVITEGFFKAIAGCSNNVPTIALLGVEMGLSSAKSDPQGKRYLVPALEKYAKSGFGFIFANDADCAVNSNVLEAQRKVAHPLKKFGAPLYNATGLWTVAEGKGMDDYIQSNGADKFKREVLGKAVNISAWEEQFKKSESGKTSKIPPADEIGSQIAESYQNVLVFNNESLAWMRYEADYSGVWSPETQESIEAIVSNILDSKGITGYGSHSYVVNIVKKMRSLLFVRKWLERSPKELLPFSNGTLELSTGKLLPHSPGYRFTWALPRAHNPLAFDWEPISRWMDEATGNSAPIKNILLCWLNAVLKGRSDLQRFLHLTGPGGSGKGTFMRLCISLLGERNNHSSSLQDWNNNRFESANAYRKRLITFADEDKYSGGLGRFKSLTGGDYLRGEEKGKKAYQFIYDGMVAVASNYPIFVGDTSSGMARRLLMLPFNYQPLKSLRRDLDKEFIPHLDALTNYILAIPDQEVTATLLSFGEDSPEVVEQAWEYRMRTDSVAAWLNECVIDDPEGMAAVGSDKDNTSTLFGSYHQYCQRTGSKAKGSREFSPGLLDLCNHILKWAGVEKLIRNNGKFVKGLRLRGEGDSHIPNPIEALSIPKVTGGIRHGDGSGDGSESLLHKESDGSDGSNQFIAGGNFSEITAIEIFQENIEVKGVAFHPSLPSLSLSSKDSDPSLDPSPHPSLDPLPVTVPVTQIVPSDVVPSDVVPSEVVPSEVVPSDVVPSDVVPSDVVPSEPLKIGDRVSGAYTIKSDYYWIGIVQNLLGEQVAVEWIEGRRAPRGVCCCSVSDLRRLSE